MTEQKTAEAKTLWTWLHLSDIHFGHGSKQYQADQADLINHFHTDVKAVLVELNIAALDAILLTGDVGFSGGSRGGDRNDEYEAATKFIDRLKTSLPAGPSVFTVPGNHDVQRTSSSKKTLLNLLKRVSNSKVTSNAAFDLLKKLRDPTSKTNLDAEIVDADQAEILKSRFANYAKFCKSVNTPLGPSADGWWAEEREIGEKNLTLHLVGLNTAFLCNDDFDQGVLSLPHTSSTEAFKDVPLGELVFVLTHHPIDWLNPRDSVHITRKLRQRRCVHLHGHIHAAEIKQTNYGSGASVVTIAAGAAHADEWEYKSGIQHTYSVGALVQLEDGSVAIRIWPRRWSREDGGSVADSEQHPSTQPYVEYVLIRPVAPVPSKASKLVLDLANDLLKISAEQGKSGYPDSVIPLRSSPLYDVDPIAVSPDFELVDRYHGNFVSLKNQLTSLVDSEGNRDLPVGDITDISSRLRLMLEGAYQQRLTFDGENRDPTGSAVTADEVFGELSVMPASAQIHVTPGTPEVRLDQSRRGPDGIIG